MDTRQEVKRRLSACSRSDPEPLERRVLDLRVGDLNRRVSHPDLTQRGSNPCNLSFFTSCFLCHTVYYTLCVSPVLCAGLRRFRSRRVLRMWRRSVCSGPWGKEMWRTKLRRSVSCQSGSFRDGRGSEGQTQHTAKGPAGRQHQGRFTRPENTSSNLKHEASSLDQTRTGSEGFSKGEFIRNMSSGEGRGCLERLRKVRFPRTRLRINLV